jgi:hypothetical protein
MARKHRPFSAPQRRSLPTINNDTAATLQNWKAKLNKTIKNSLPAPTPYNFAVTSARGGLKITWSPVQTPADTSLGSPDGYELLRSVNGTFTDDLQVIPIKNVGQSNYFDSTNGNSQTVSYRIRTTAGTSSNPQAMRGPESGVVAHTSIDANDTKSTPTTVLDNYTTSKIRSLARKGNYGLQSAYRTSLGEVGGSAPVPSGTVSAGGSGSGSGSGSSGSSSSSAAASAPTFDQIQSGENQTAQMIVGGGASIVPDVDDPGIISATSIQGIPVNPTTPDHNGELLIYDSASGTYIPGDPLVQGVEAAGATSTTNPVQMGGVDAAGRVQKLAVDPDGGLPDVKMTNVLLMNILQTLQRIAAALNAGDINTV